MKSPVKSKIKQYNEQALPNIKEGMTLDKYFGCNFAVVTQSEDFKFDKEFGCNAPKEDSLQLYFDGFLLTADDFEINETDEDLYTESNCENSSKMSKKRNLGKQNKIPEFAINNEIQQKIMNKYQKKKNRSIHRKEDEKLKISIRIEYPQQNFHSQQITKNKKQLIERMQQKDLDECANSQLT